MLPEAGTFEAKTTSAVVYETTGGALMVALDMAVDEQTAIMAHQCLVSKAGDVMAKTIANLRDVYGWPGDDPFWLQDTDLSQIPVQIVVEMRQDASGELRPEVAWINKPGGGRWHPEAADRNAVLAKYGNKFRALAGGKPVQRLQQQSKAATAATSAPPANATPPAQDAPPRKPAAPANIQEAWNAFCQAAGEAWTDEGLGKAWFAAIQEITGKANQGELSPEDWGQVAAGAAAFLTNQVPY